MKRYKGTKGKWWAKMRTWDRDVLDSRGRIIANVHCCEDNGIALLTQSDANAQLIATAPELLEALIAMIDIVDNTSGLTGWHMNGDVAYWEEFRDVDIARDVINKALGL